jgi:hypothetical protein
LLCCRSFEQCLQLLAPSSFLGGCRLRAAAQQHGCSGEVLGRPPEEWRCFVVRVDVRARVGASIVAGSGACRCATARLIGSRSAPTPVFIPFAGLALHRNILREASIAIPIMGLALHRHALCRSSLAWLGFDAKLLV